MKRSQNPKNLRIKDTDLHAYVDGQLSADRARQVEDFLARNPAKAAEVQDWMRQNRGIEGLDQLLGEGGQAQLPRRLNPHYLAQKNGRSFTDFKLVAASLVIFVVGGFFGMFVENVRSPNFDGTPTLTDYAFSAHRIYAVDVARPVEVDASSEAQLVSWLSKRVGEPLAAPDLSAQGFELVGGRLLPSGATAAAQFMYEDATGLRITLYAKTNDTDQLASFRFATLEQYNAFYWLDSELSFALVGEASRETLRQMATSVFEQLT